MERKIYLKHWLELKPYNKQTTTDSYYLILSNEIRDAIFGCENFVLKRYINENDINLLSCFLASYFEDVISETNIWRTFVSIHFELYNKKLPFYNTNEYYDDEINEQDIAFLIWYFLNTIQEKKFISPYNSFIKIIASEVMQILEEEYEFAPENNFLKQFYQLDNNEKDYYVARHYLDTIFFNTYLFYPDTAVKLQVLEKEILEEKDENVMMYLNDSRDNFLIKKATRLLALKAKEWGAHILGLKHPLSIDLLSMSQKISGYFLYKGQDESDIFLEHIATGKDFKLTKKSYDYYTELNEIDCIIYIGIVQWKNQWWFSGVNFITEFDADLILDERNSAESRMQVNFLDHQKEKTSELLKQQLDAFLSFNNGSPIAFMRSDKIDEFTKKYTDFFNNTLNLTKKQKQEAEKRARKNGYFNNEDDNIDFSERSKTALFFFNPNSGGEIALEINSAFPLKNNPFFDVKKSENDIKFLLMSEELSTELAMYCIDNCSDKLPFLNNEIGKRYLEDIDFLLRFWKKEYYHSKPSITYTG
ncbi:MAG: DUF3843 family protein [Chlorobi bacterium]|nr:DUF3843 family protein [Chlorobiota bacterium]